jgi:hypothetical protein
VIPLDYITEWRTEAPWIMTSQVEQDLMLSRALVEMLTESSIGESLAFRGGTALYKLHFTASRRAAVDLGRVVTCFNGYLGHDGTRVSRAKFEMNMHEKLSDDTFLADVEPLIAPASDWNVDAAAAFVMHEIAPLLSGEPWRGGGPSGS